MTSFGPATAIPDANISAVYCCYYDCSYPPTRLAMFGEFSSKTPPAMSPGAISISAAEEDELSGSGIPTVLAASAILSWSADV